MRRWAALAFVALHVGVMFLQINSIHEIPYSALWSFDAGIASLIITGPVLAGYAAADSYLLRTGGVNDLVSSLPITAQCRMYLARTFRDVSLGLVAIIVSIGLGQIIAAFNSSYIFDWSILLLLLPSIGILSLFSLVGRMLGYIFPLAITSLVVALGLYGVTAFFPDFLHVFYGYTSANITYLSRYNLMPALLLSLSYILIALAAFGIIVARMNLLRWAEFLGVFFLCTVTFFHARLPIDSIWLQSDEVDDQQWVCADLDIESVATVVCIPRDQERDIDLLRYDLRKTVQQLAFLDRSLVRPVYNSPVDPESYVGFPFAQSERDASGAIGYIVGNLPQCDQQGEELEFGDDVEYQEFEAARTLSEERIFEWLARSPDPDGPDPAEVELLREDLQIYRGCR